MGESQSGFRASDADRDRVIGLLQDSAVDGRLSHDSFVHRLDLAVRARDRQSLDALVGDLQEPLPSPVQLLRLPEHHRPVVVIGRSRSCDVVLRDPTVSRVHASLRLFGDRWFLDDLGSTNGTYVNQFRVRAGTLVQPGDRLRLGRTLLQLAQPG